MAFAIHKPGQGYWVRVLTGVMVAILTVALAAWLYGQSAIVADSLPKSQYSAELVGADGAAPAAGTAVSLLSAPDATGTRVSLGSAVLASVNTDSKLVSLTGVKLADGKEALGSEIRRVVAVGASGTDGLNVVRPAGVAPISAALLGGSVAIAVLILGTIIGYWLAGVREKTSEFLIATDFEMKKVNWSTPSLVMNQTWVVIFAMIFLAILLFFVDGLFQRLFALIGLLPK
jgi:preprotein translocase SecE subunit